MKQKIKINLTYIHKSISIYAFKQSFYYPNRNIIQISQLCKRKTDKADTLITKYFKEYNMFYFQQSFLEFLKAYAVNRLFQESFFYRMSETHENYSSFGANEIFYLFFNLYVNIRFDFS